MAVLADKYNSKKAEKKYSRNKTEENSMVIFTG
jgi:hypothetical protein